MQLLIRITVVTALATIAPAASAQSSATAKPAAPAKGAAPAPSLTIPQMETAVTAHEKRTELLSSELKELDGRIEKRVASLVDALTLIGDTKDSGTKVARMKSSTITALKKNLEYYQRQRANLMTELKKPTTVLTAEQKQKAIDAVDARCERRVAQILQIQKSLPTEQDYDRYKATGSNWTGTSYELNEDYTHNKKLTAVTNAQRREITEGLRKSISRLEQQNRTLKTKGAPDEEIQKNEALIAERKQQLAVALAPIETPTRQIGGKEAADLDKALQTAVSDLKDEFTTLFVRFNSLIKELSSLNQKRDYLAKAKAAAKP
jgi:hypothetical protein